MLLFLVRTRVVSDCDRRRQLFNSLFLGLSVYNCYTNLNEPWQTVFASFKIEMIWIASAPGLRFGTHDEWWEEHAREDNVEWQLSWKCYTIWFLSSTAYFLSTIHTRKLICGRRLYIVGMGLLSQTLVAIMSFWNDCAQNMSLFLQRLKATLSKKTAFAKDVGFSTRID